MKIGCGNPNGRLGFMFNLRCSSVDSLWLKSKCFSPTTSHPWGCLTHETGGTGACAGASTVAGEDQRQVFNRPLPIQVQCQSAKEWSVWQGRPAAVAAALAAQATRLLGDAMSRCAGQEEAAGPFTCTSPTSPEPGGSPTSPTSPCYGKQKPGPIPEDGCTDACVRLAASAAAAMLEQVRNYTL